MSAVPKGVFILARVFTAHPQASRIGARLRSLGFSQANTMDGPDITKIIPTSDIGICHHANRKNPVITEAIAVLMAPIAKPIAAKIPVNLATSKGWAIGAFPVSAVLVAPETLIDAWSIVALSRRETKLLIKVIISR